MSWLLPALLVGQALPLAGRHQEWLERDVHFLITTGERERFAALATEAERDDFVERFWERRDPDPATLLNEARVRHEELLAESDRLFTLVRSRAGRLTERGRIYQLLGPPRSRESFTRAENRLYPLELWLYAGMTVPFLPESFYLIFFREGGYGDYRLWSPTADGPQALIRSHQPGELLLRPGDALRELRRIDAELALAVGRLVPGEAEDLPAFAAESLLNDLEAFPDLAERHLRLREEVRATASFRKLDASHLAVVLRDAEGMDQVHYAIELDPETVVWEEEGARRRSRFTVTGRVLNESEREIDRFEDRLEVQSSGALADEPPLSFQGRLVLVPGRYRIETSIVDATGGGSSSASSSVEVRDDAAGVSEIVLVRSRRVLEGGELLDRLPFQLGATVLSPSPDAVFPPAMLSATLQLWGVTEPVSVEWNLSRDGATLWQSVSTVAPGNEPWTIAEQDIPLQGLDQGVYSVEAVLPFARRTAELRVEDSRRLETVRVLSRESFPAGHGRLSFQRGVLFARRGDAERAIEEMKIAAGKLPRDLEVHLQLGVLLSSRSRHREAHELLALLVPYHPREPDLLVLLGFTCLELDRVDEAISYYEKAAAERPEDPRLRKALAEARARRPEAR